MSIRVGLGSWSDDAYGGVLYPPDVPARDRLRAYAAIFNHVEVNSTYYGTPKPETVRKWIEETPRGFLFDIKLHRVIAMNPARAADPPPGKRDLVALLLERLSPLADAGKLGVFLLLLPERFKPETHRLDELQRLAARLHPHPLAVELRCPGWMRGAQRKLTLAELSRLGLVWVGVDMPKGPEFMPPVNAITRRGIAYLRLHGRNRAGYLKGKSAAAAHDYRYKRAEIAELAKRIQALAQKALEVRVVCNNHHADDAPRVALALRAMLSLIRAADAGAGKRPGRAPGRRGKALSPPTRRARPSP